MCRRVMGAQCPALAMRALLLALCIALLQGPAAAEAGPPSQPWRRSASLQQTSAGQAASLPAAEPDGAAWPGSTPPKIAPPAPLPATPAAKPCSLLDALKRSPNATTFVEAATATGIAP